MVNFQRLKIERLGQRGEGVAQGRDGLVFVPHAVPGDEVMAEVDGERGAISEILAPSPQRIAPFCKFFGECGGCAVQTLEAEPYQIWKRDLLVKALAHARVEARVGALIDAHGEGRRRATFHARIKRDGLNRPHVVSGFMRARAHEIVDIDVCPILAPALKDAPAAAQGVAEALASLDKPLDITVTATNDGLDVDFRGTGKIEARLQQKLVKLAEDFDLARLSNHGEIVIERRPARLAMGSAMLQPPPGAFLQATQAGEDNLSRLVIEAVATHAGKAKRIGDFFAGVGTFALRLAERAAVHAVENDASLLLALERAANGATGLRSVTSELRDLFRRPLAREELAKFDAIVFDPPRAGAEAQAHEMATSAVPLIVAVSCNVQTFARDAKILIEGGYTMGEVTPVDQFRHSSHLEMVAAFTKPAKPKRRLLG